MKDKVLEKILVDYFVIQDRFAEGSRQQTKILEDMAKAMIIFIQYIIKKETEG